MISRYLIAILPFFITDQICFAKSLDDPVFLQRLTDDEITNVIGDGIMVIPANSRDAGPILTRSEKFLRNNGYDANADWASFSGKCSVSGSQICISVKGQVNQCKQMYKDRSGNLYMSYNSGSHIINVIAKKN